MKIAVEEHEYRLYLPVLSCSLPKEIAGCICEGFTDLGESGVAIRYRFGEVLVADIFVYDAGSEILEDGADAEAFQHYAICKAGVEALRQGGTRLVSEGLYAVHEFPGEPQFCCAVFETPSLASAQPSTLTHLFLRSVQGCFFKVRFSHSAQDAHAAVAVITKFIGEVISILKGRA